jgi:hypothetical protein
MTGDPLPLPMALDQLIACFNRRIMDVPDGFFDRNARFTLNGVPFEALLGRAGEDPLVRMIARGVAGYRFAARPLLHALETALVARVRAERDGDCWDIVLALRGTLRGSGHVFEETVQAALRVGETGAVVETHVSIDPRALDSIRAARQA